MADDIGFIYLAVNDTMPGLVKIGYTKGDVQERMKELSADTGVPAPFKCAYSCKVQNPAEAEKQLHQNFFYCRESGNREFFRADWRVVQAVIEDDFQTLRRSTKRKKIAKKGEPVGKFTLVKWVKEGDAENVRRVLAIGGKPDQADEYKQTSLMWAARLGHADIANILLDKGANPNKTLKNGQTALMLAAEHGQDCIIKTLLDYGAHVNATDKDQSTALMQCRYASLPVKILVDNGARVNMTDKDGKTALMCLSSCGAEAVKILVDGGAKVDMADKDGRTALMHAGFADHPDYAKALLDHGANPDATDEDGFTALIQATLCGLCAGLPESDSLASDFIEVLLAGGANPEKSDCYGVTALMHAVYYGRTNSVHALLEGGANPNEKFESGDTVLTIAEKNSNDEIIRMLKAAGAK